MTQKPQARRGLGRGLGSLIPTAPRPEDGAHGAHGADGATPAADGTDGAPPTVPPDGSTGNGAPVAPVEPEGAGLQPVTGAYFAELPVTAISPNPRQPRQVFDEDAMAELVHSISEIGLLQPVVVRPVGGPSEGRFELMTDLQILNRPVSLPAYRPTR